MSQRKTIKIIGKIIKKDPTIMDRIKSPKDTLDQHDTLIMALNQCDINKPLHQ